MTVVSASPLEAARACAAEALRILHETIAGGRDATFAVSGGSTPKLMFEAMVASSDFADWGRVHLFWVDERCVPPTDGDSNYKLAMAAFQGVIPEANVHRVFGELPPEEAASRYGAELLRYFGSAEAVRFDVMHCGMGPDAHTASLFPGDARHIGDREGLAAAVYAPKLPNWRVTVLPRVLLQARHTLLLVTGADKRETLDRVKGPGAVVDVEAMPVQLLVSASWFLDEAAAGGKSA